MSAAQQYRRGQAAALSTQVSYKEEKNPLKLAIKDILKNDGDKARIRVLDFTKGTGVTLRTKNYETRGGGTWNHKMFGTVIPFAMYSGDAREPDEDDIIQTIDLDDPSLIVHVENLDGSTFTMPLNEVGVDVPGEEKYGYEGSLHRVLVYIYDVLRAPANSQVPPVLEPWGNAFFLELNWNQYKMLKNLANENDGDFEFGVVKDDKGDFVDSGTGSPEFDIYLSREDEGESKKKKIAYKFRGIKKEYVNGKATRNDDANYMVSAEDVFGESFDEVWAKATEAITSMKTDFPKLSDVKFKIGPKRKAKSEDTPAIASTPTAPAEDDAVADEPVRETRRVAPVAEPAVEENPDGEPEIKMGARRTTRRA